MHVRFWGTRGSLPKSGPGTVRYGGNTSCVEVRSNRGTLVMIDCGSGAHAFGQELMKTDPKLKHGHMLISHTHWDHIQGFPFFTPLFIPGMSWDIYGPKGLGSSLHAALSEQMQYTYFPIGIEKLGAKIRFHELMEGTFEIDDIVVRTQYLNHPGLALAYRLEADGASVVYACDHEPNCHDLACGNGHVTGSDLDHAEFLAEADLVIHDAQYTPEQYSQKVGWGHSTPEYATLVSQFAGASKLAITHHDPLHVDDDIDALVNAAKEKTLKPGSSLEVFPAGDGQRVDLPKRGKKSAGNKTGNARDIPFLTAEDLVVYLWVSQADKVKLISEGLNMHGVSVKSMSNHKALISALAKERPSMIIMDQDTPGLDSVEFWEQLRSSQKKDAPDIPVMVIGDNEDPALYQAGILEWLIEPFSSEYLWTRVTACLLRNLRRKKSSQSPASRLMGLLRGGPAG